MIRDDWLFCNIYSGLFIGPQLIINIMLKLILRQTYRFSSQYSGNINLATSSSTFHSSQMTKSYRQQLLPLPDYNDPSAIPFGKYHSDHMISVDYDIKNGWHHPKLEPFHHLSLNPFISGLHYGIQCYEGTKAYKNEKGQVRLFRPECNALRFKRSSMRLTMPDFDGNELINLIEELVRLEERWIPPKSGYGLYIRPFHFSVDDALGVKKPDKTKMMIVTSPVGPYYPTGYKPISLYCSHDHIRTAPKGTGHFKVGGNYAPCIETTTEVEHKGHQQVLWLWEGKVLEVGSSNIFFVFKNKDGIQVVTPELGDMVLPGVTRDSIVELFKRETDYKMTERELYWQEVLQRHKKGQLIETFGTGTAVIVSSVKNIEYQGKNYEIPIDPSLNFGRIAHEIRSKLLDIQQGRTQDKYGWVRRLK